MANGRSRSTRIDPSTITSPAPGPSTQISPGVRGAIGTTPPHNQADLDIAVSSEEVNVERLNLAPQAWAPVAGRWEHSGTVFATNYGRLEIVRRADALVITRTGFVRHVSIDSETD